MHQAVGEKIEAVVVYKNEKMYPVKFRWQERVYKISNINGEWTEKEGIYKKFFYVAECGGEEVYELFLHNGDMIWRLNSIASLSRPY